MIPETIFVIIFILGACIGSFLNVCIYRIPRNQSIISPRSSCPFCKKTIPIYFNIPLISFLILKGKCKYCLKPISLVYPSIETLTGFFALILFMKFGFTLETLFWFVFICVLLVISFIDMATQTIPDIISLPCIIIFSLSCFFIPEISFKDTLAGIFIGGGILYFTALLYYLIRKEHGMGGGDIKLIAMIGAATGFKGVLFTIFTGSVFGTFLGIIIIFKKNEDIKLKIPFAPFLSAGVITYIFFGKQFIYWYFNVLS
ncbi:MAG: prepilin peptidase [Desulfobacteraceae bacterium 4572_130]|nr:MAG: prepilin peptidase [Desulfobacteraceae bacterium 4572_130]